MRRLSLAALLLLVGCPKPAKVPASGPKLGGSTAAAASASLAPLAGFNIWVQVADPSTRQAWCDAFAAEGLDVRCEQSPIVDDYEVFLKCPSLPDGAGELLAAFTGQPDLEIWDWRTDPDFGPAYCSEYDGISLELLR